MNKHKLKEVSLNGKTINCVTYAGLGEMCGGRKARTIRRLVEKQVLAPPYMRMPNEEYGAWLFPLEYAKRLSRVINAEITPRQKINPNTIAKLWEIYKEEKSKL